MRSEYYSRTLPGLTECGADESYLGAIESTQRYSLFSKFKLVIARPDGSKLNLPAGVDITIKI